MSTHAEFVPPAIFSVEDEHHRLMQEELFGPILTVMKTNTPCTGALVHRQPFGGFGMSGVGAKAGGPGYLLQFADARAVAENTTRHGFIPDVFEA